MTFFVYPNDFHKDLLNTIIAETNSDTDNHTEWFNYMLSKFIPINIYDPSYFRLIVGKAYRDNFFSAKHPLAIIAVEKNASYGLIVHETVHFIQWLSNGFQFNRDGFHRFFDEINAYVYGWLLDNYYLDTFKYDALSMPWEREIFTFDFEELSYRMSKNIKDEFKQEYYMSDEFKQLVYDAVNIVFNQLKISDDFIKKLMIVDRASRDIECMVLSHDYEPSNLWRVYQLAKEVNQ